MDSDPMVIKIDYSGGTEQAIPIRLKNDFKEKIAVYIATRRGLSEAHVVDPEREITMTALRSVGELVIFNFRHQEIPYFASLLWINSGSKIKFSELKQIGDQQEESPNITQLRQNGTIETIDVVRTDRYV